MNNLRINDYYPGGMPMPNRNVEGNYRYGYQGEYAEKEEIGSTNSFELRLYDSRINRWLTTDPEGQYHSPYLSMGNNWVNQVDPDGGFDTWIGARLYKLFTGTEGNIEKNEHGDYNIVQNYYDKEFDIESSVLINGSSWERNLSGLFSLYKENDVSFVQFSADPAIPTFMNTNYNLSVKRSKKNVRVQTSDYNFKAFASTRSSNPEAGYTNGILSTSIRISGTDFSEVWPLRHKPSKEPQFIGANNFMGVEFSFRIKNEVKGPLQIDIHHLQWLVKGTNPGLEIGHKFTIPAGIDPATGFMSTTFLGKRNLFGK